MADMEITPLGMDYQASPASTAYVRREQVMLEGENLHALYIPKEGLSRVTEDSSYEEEEV